MGVCAHRAAPVQVNYLGFPATLGANYMDYIIADTAVIPPGEEGFYDEQLVTLPGSYQANDDKGRPMARVGTRAQAGLPETGTVFCNFNNAYKLTPSTFDSWTVASSSVDAAACWRLLDAAPPCRQPAQRSAKSAAGAGAPDLRTRPGQHRSAPGAATLADLFLDGLPYNAHTTGSDALVGVPLVTQAAPAFPGRVAASLLSAAGLPELITEDVAVFEALAIKLGKDAKALKTLKDKLAKNKTTCALFDTATFTRHIESAYETMWQAWLAGEKPKAFAVKG
ncbi:MAG: hypothetical protein U1E93_09155 [Alphaproteobacteria bacterium]